MTKSKLHIRHNELMRERIKITEDYRKAVQANALSFEILLQEAMTCYIESDEPTTGFVIWKYLCKTVIHAFSTRARVGTRV